MCLGLATTRFFKLPSWTIPALCFNNTTSLPLLLIQSLDATGILKSLLRSDTDTTSAAVDRAKSYFLVCAIVGNCLTFALGPKLLDGEEAPTKSAEGDDAADGEDTEQGNGQHHLQEEDDRASINEQTSLLPDSILQHGRSAGLRGYQASKKRWDNLPTWVQAALDFLYAFVNAPLIGAVLGMIIGLVPRLHRAFFNEQQNGGFLNAWVTTSVKNVGDLFASLQVLVVGVKLSSSLRKMKRGEDSGQVPWIPMIFVLVTRFVVWPIISIGVIFLVASRTSWLQDDPILWFAMMLMPTGPPAMKLTALADVNGSNEEEKLSIAKFLTIAYAVSPLIAFAVVGSLKASEAAMTS